MSVHDDFEDFEGPVRLRSAIQGPSPAEFGALTLVANVTTAEVNAGKVLLPAITGYRYRVLDWKMAARGGAAGTATSVDIKDTADTPVSVAIALVAALTQNKVVGPGMANVTDGAVGGMGKPLTVSKGVQIKVAGSALDTATSVDVTITYAMEKV
jgi:hypothetical protein